MALISHVWFTTTNNDYQLGGYTLPNQDGWRIVDHLFPPEALALMDAFVNGHRTKVGMPRDDVHTLTTPYVVKTLRECAPDDSVTGDHNKKMNFVCNLINKTGNRIPESRADGIKMYKAITTVINASPSEFTQNMESFRRYINWYSVYRSINPSQMVVN